MSYGKLFLVGTPIGNLADITFRAIDVLKSVDMIAAEDTRHTIKLLNYYSIKKSLISYHKYNENQRGDQIIQKLKSGLNIAVVTDAGMPGISDPGSVVLKKCIAEELQFEVIPGVSAGITALVYSGLDTSGFMFKGFLPKDNKSKKEIINEIINLQESLIFYEAPHRLVKTLEYFRENLGNRKIAICRELTKIHEDIKRFTLDEAIKYYKENEAKGEFVLIISGKSKDDIEKENIEIWEDISIEDHISMYIKQGKSKKEAIKLTAKDRKLPKSEVYRYSLKL